MNVAAGAFDDGAGVGAGNGGERRRRACAPSADADNEDGEPDDEGANDRTVRHLRKSVKARP